MWAACVVGCLGPEHVLGGNTAFVVAAFVNRAIALLSSKSNAISVCSA